MSDKFTENDMNEAVENHNLTEIEILALLKWVSEIENECKNCRKNLHKLNQQPYVSTIDLEYGFCRGSLENLFDKAESLKRCWANCSFNQR